MRSILLSCSLLLSAAGFLSAQTTLNCYTTPIPPIVRAEGFAERIADVVYTCSGSPNLAVAGNFTVALNTEITNRLSTGSNLTGIVLTVDSGNGPQTVQAQPYLSSPNTLAYNNVPIPVAAQGSIQFRIAGIRANATRIPVGQQIIASLALNGANLGSANAQVPVGTPQKSLYAGFSSKLVCAQNGSPLPSVIGFQNLLQANTALSSIRFTEGFADAFGNRAAPEYLNADSGQRVIVQYSGFPSGARLFVPDVIAGSDAVRPTAGGDFELPASGGAYAPVSGGSLLLARVAGAGSAGAGGTPVYTPGTIGSATVQFDSVSELTLSSGAAFVVYEVVDANPSRVESAQFPTFLGLSPDGNRPPAQTDAHIYLAPTSTVNTATATDPLPRFNVTEPLQDCTLLGDCATLLPQLSLEPAQLDLTVTTPGTVQSYFLVKNNGGGVMQWTTSINYANGSGWLVLQPSQGTQNTTVQVFAQPQTLAAGTYHATVIVNGGPYTTPQTVTINFVVPTNNGGAPSIASFLNAASFATVPAVPGSLSTIMGSGFSGKIVSVTFNGIPATILYMSDSQINVQVPASLPTTGSAQVVVTADGKSSLPRAVSLAAFAPAIFGGAALNQNASVNSINNPAGSGDIVAVFSTGLSGSGQITAHLADQDISAPYYAGPAPGLVGVQQVNVKIPDSVHGMAADLSVCGQTDTKVCSPAIPLYVK